MRASGKWEISKPFPESTNLASIIEVLKKDEHGCFFGWFYNLFLESVSFKYFKV
jgi:hypothetical protein